MREKRAGRGSQGPTFICTSTSISSILIIVTQWRILITQIQLYIEKVTTVTTKGGFLLQICMLPFVCFRRPDINLRTQLRWFVCWKHEATSIGALLTAHCKLSVLSSGHCALSDPNSDFVLFPEFPPSRARLA